MYLLELGAPDVVAWACLGYARSKKDKAQSSQIESTPLYIPGTKVSTYGGLPRRLQYATVPRRRSGEGNSVILHGQRGGVINLQEYTYTIINFPAESLC